MARMITAPGIIRNVNKYLNSMRKVPFAIGVDDWEAVTGGFQAPFLSQYVTASSFEIGTYNDSIKAAESGINFEKNGLGTGLTFFCEVKPTATISGDLYVFDNNDGKVPVILEDTVIDFENGGTGASNLAGAQENLGITALAEHLALKQDKIIYNSYEITKSISNGDSWADTSIPIPSKKYVAWVNPETPNVIAGISAYGGRLTVPYRSNETKSNYKFTVIVIQFND